MKMLYNESNIKSGGSILNIFYLEWKSFCNEDLFEILQEMGHTVIKIPFQGVKESEEAISKLLEKSLRTASCDFLFSFNYFPKVSDYCNKHDIRYVSWVYDSPYIHAYSYTVLNPCNMIFLFDYAMYEELKGAGIPTVYYLPLAVNHRRLGRLKNRKEMMQRHSCDISFVGSLYSEQKHRIYDKFQNIGPYARGYLNGLIRAQIHVQGTNFLQEMLSENILEELEKVYPSDPNASSVLSPEAIYADYILARQVTATERREILEMLGVTYGGGQKKSIHLYTHDRNLQLPGICNRGPVDYYDEMPYVFLNTKINLNISLRSIKTGIPLRAMDIMGCGGFLLTNYQEEMFQYFEADKDFVYYTDYDDLKAKVDYYLRHDEERRKIAANGCQKVLSQHNLKLRMEQILSELFQKNEG